MKTFYLWTVGGSYPRDVISETPPEFKCSPVLKDGAPTSAERQKTLPMSDWHESVEADSWKDAKALFKQAGLLMDGAGL